MVRRVRPSSMATQTSAMTSSERTLSFLAHLIFFYYCGFKRGCQGTSLRKKEGEERMHIYNYF